jgi:hypothetical protein
MQPLLILQGIYSIIVCKHHSILLVPSPIFYCAALENNILLHIRLKFVNPTGYAYT